MNKILLFTIVSTAALFSFGQGQIGNSDMEQWESVASGEEPNNWNSFLSATGGWAWAASDQVQSSTDVRPGSAGVKSCRIWSNSSFGIIANGNVTLGQINMGSTTPSDASNYNFSKTSDANHSEMLADTPDSLVFWAKFTPNGGNGNARMKATLHDNYDYQDPEDGTSATHVVATAVVNFPSTGGNWTRFSIPFDYSGPASGNTHILVTFTTNEIPGGGDADDEVLIDDVELIYNPSGIESIISENTYVSMNNMENVININSTVELNGAYSIYNTQGQLIQNGTISNSIDFSKVSGVYFVVLTSGNIEQSFKIIKY